MCLKGSKFPIPITKIPLTLERAAVAILPLARENPRCSPPLCDTSRPSFLSPHFCTRRRVQAEPQPPEVKMRGWIVVVLAVVTLGMMADARAQSAPSVSSLVPLMPDTQGFYNIRFQTRDGKEGNYTPMQDLPSKGC